MRCRCPRADTMAPNDFGGSANGALTTIVATIALVWRVLLGFGDNVEPMVNVDC